MATILQQNWIDQNRNRNSGFSIDKLAGYQDAGVGVLRTLQVGQKGLKLAAELMGQTPEMKTIESKLGTGIGTLGFARLIPTAVSTFKATKTVAENANDGVSLGRKATVLLKESTDMLASWSRAYTFIKANPTLQTFADIADSVGDSADLGMSVQDYCQSSKLERSSNGDAKEVFAHTKRYNMLRIAKAVTSIVSGVLGLLMLVLGAPVLPAVALIVISLSSTVLSIVRDNYKNVGSFNAFNFDRDVRSLQAV